MLSGIYYDDHPGGDSVCVWYQAKGDDLPGQPLVHIIRPREKDFYKQLIYLHHYAALRMERSGEIMTEITNILSFLGAVGHLHASRTPRLFELLSLVLRVTGVIEMRVKHALACRRAVEFSPQIQPMIATPGHGSLPSGHATESFAAAFVFYALIRRARSQSAHISQGEQTFIQLMRIAERIAINRTVAGVHFPVDSVAGMVLGWTLADFYVKRFSGRGDVKTRHFDGRWFDDDFCYEKVLARSYRKHRDEDSIPQAADSDENITEGGDDLDIPVSGLLKYQWDEAVAECKLMLGPPPDVQP